MRYLRTPLDLPLLFFVLSALIGVWASYDPAASWHKFALIVAAVAIYYAVVPLRAAPQLLELFVWLFLLGSAALTVYFATQHDYVGEGKFGPITELGLFLNRIVPQLPFHVSHPNVVAGALEIALPVNVALIASQKSKVKNKKSLFVVYCSLFTGLLISFGLLMTSSRGAWLALGVVGVAVVLLVVARDALRRYALPLAVIGVLAAFIGVVQLGESLQPALDNLLGAIPAGNSVVSRAELFRQAWGLIRDYYFTGSGLGVFPMILSTYALLIDVPFLTHAHNLFLEIWIEQGLLGFVAFGWLIVAFYLWVWRERRALNWLGLGAVAAATVMLLHGFVDVGLYSSRALPLMFVPMGMAVASRQSSVNSGRSTVNSQQSTVKEVGRKRKVILGVLVLLFTVYCLLFTGSALAALGYANLGSVAQTRVELGQYQWPQRLVENVRREGGMSKAEEYFRRALALDAGNVTANQRLGVIALARGEHDAALNYLQAAYRRDPNNPVTERLLSKTR